MLSKIIKLFLKWLLINFGAYITENYQATAIALKLSKQEVIQLAENSFRASFLTFQAQNALIAELNSYSDTNLY